MNNSGRYVQGWSREPPPHHSSSSRLNIVEPAMSNPRAPNRNQPHIPYRQQPQSMARPSFDTSNNRANNNAPPINATLLPGQGQVSVQNQRDTSRNKEPFKLNPLAESFKGSLVIASVDQNDDSATGAGYSSRRIRVEAPALDSQYQQGPVTSFSKHRPHQPVHSVATRTGEYGHGRQVPHQNPFNKPYHPSPLDTSQVSTRSVPPSGRVLGRAPQAALPFHDPAETRAFVLGRNGRLYPPSTLDTTRHLSAKPARNPFLEVGSLNADYVHYLHLGRSSYDNRILFRVHDKSSKSPLVWSGTSITSGFFATSSVFSHLTPKAYEALFKSYGPEAEEGRGFKDEGWLARPLMREIMIRHILCKPPNLFISSNTFPEFLRLNQKDLDTRLKVESKQDGYWISTSRSIDWAIFEIARRLVEVYQTGKGEREIRLAIINAKPTLSSLKEGNGSVQVGKVLERKLDPNLCLARFEPKILSPNKLETSIKARKAARESFEIVYWGRIFGENVEEDLIFTAEQLPFKLPAKFWKPSGESNSSRSPRLPGWLGRLRWDPTKDTWPTALERLRSQVYPTTKWIDQPVHNWGSTWRPSLVSSYTSQSQAQHDPAFTTSLKVVSDEEDDTDRIGSLRQSGFSNTDSRGISKKVEVIDLMMS